MFLSGPVFTATFKLADW